MALWSSKIVSVKYSDRHNFWPLFRFIAGNDFGLMKKSYLLFLLTALMAERAAGQVRRSRWQAGREIPPLGVIKLIGGGGLSYYQGDVRKTNDLTHIEPQVGFGFSYRLTERVSVRSEVRFYRISGSQPTNVANTNNLSFRSDNPDGYLAAQVDLRRFNDRPRTNYYLFGGVGVTYLSPKALYKNEWVSLPPLQTEKVAYARTTLVLLAGVGVSHQVAERWSLGVELSNNFSTSDYMDDVSTVYPNPAGMTERALALSDRRPEIGLGANQPGFIRGNPKAKDSYIFLSLKAEYLLANRAQARAKRKLRCSY